jgi:hypothetical protein
MLVIGAAGLIGKHVVKTLGESECIRASRGRDGVGGAGGKGLSAAPSPVRRAARGLGERAREIGRERSPDLDMEGRLGAAPQHDLHFIE